MERPELEAADGLDAVDEHFETVPEVEAGGPSGKRLEGDGPAARVGPTKPVSEQGSTQAAALSVRVDGEQTEVPVRPGGDEGDSGADRLEDGFEPNERHGTGEVGEAGPSEALGRLAGSVRELPGGNRAEVTGPVDVAEEFVVADGCAEEPWREAVAIRVGWKEVGGERILVEGAGDERPGAVALARPEWDDGGGGPGQRL